MALERGLEEDGMLIEGDDSETFLMSQNSEHPNFHGTLGRQRYQSLVAAYGEAKRQRFLSELAHMEENVHLARSQARNKLDKYAIQQMVEDKLAWERHSFEERISRAPEILVRLRSHTVWERMSVKLCFTVQGFPTPVVQW
ncbi:Myomesin-2 [Saguinus oedipus]|uniref:Myomesin-2 n=1 Tax=Saguinus oedipus TaxID=9490 RepID=A0ABQ9UBB0_SAGOE|nr:Myomesin-2 [Saguinus oedipus]